MKKPESQPQNPDHSTIPMDRLARQTPQPGTWWLVVAPGPLCGTWLQLVGVARTSCPQTPRLLIFDGGRAPGASEEAAACGFTLPPEFVRPLPPATWGNLWPRLRTRLVASVLRFVTRLFARESAELADGPTRGDKLLAELRDLRRLNVQLIRAVERSEAEILNERLRAEHYRQRAGMGGHN